MTRVPDRYDVEERAACILVLRERARGGRGKRKEDVTPRKFQWSRRVKKKTEFFPPFFFLSRSPSSTPARPASGNRPAPAVARSLTAARYGFFSPGPAREEKLVPLNASCRHTRPLSKKRDKKRQRKKKLGEVFYISSKNQKMHDEFFSGCFPESNQEMRGTWEGKVKRDEREKRGEKRKLLWLSVQQRQKLPFLSLSPLSLSSFFRSQLFPLRAYARVVLRGLPASETSHHLWSETTFRREEISQDAEVRILVCARKHFFALLLRV